jgi:hypothetical protein
MGQTRRAERQEDSPEGTDVRCGCGALVARERGGWLEVRCRRCKRGIRLRWHEGRLVVEQALAS